MTKLSLGTGGRRFGATSKFILQALWISCGNPSEVMRVGPKGDNLRGHDFDAECRGAAQ